jgi:hypothetical protein
MTTGCLAFNYSYLSLISFVNVFTVNPKEAYPAKDGTTGLTEKGAKDFNKSITRKDVTEAWLVMPPRTTGGRPITTRRVP